MAEKSYSHHPIENDDEVCGRSKTSKFFKIVFDPRALRLRIPDKFIQMHGQNLRNPVFLRVPTGSKMEVELLIHPDGKEAWLQKGWPEFRDFYGIGFGQLLVFEYNGNSQFDVAIFDMSACEIEYPDNHDEGIFDTDNVTAAAYHRPSPTAEENGYDSDESVVFLAEVEKYLENIHDYIDNPINMETKKRKRGKQDDDDDDDDDDDAHCSDECTIIKSSVREMQNPSCCSKSGGGLTSKTLPVNINQSTRSSPGRRESSESKFQKECSRGGDGGQGVSDQEQQGRRKGRRVIVDKKESIAYQRAVAFKSVNPSPNPFSILVLQPSYVSKAYLNVPAAFAEENLSRSKHDLTLRGLSGKRWAVKCCFYPSKTNVFQSILTVGWKAFVKDNDLKPGDACVFEAVKGTQLLWNVFIFRNE